MDVSIETESAATDVPEANWLTDRIEATLKRLAPPFGGSPARLAQAIRYSLLAPGKRVRARLAIFVGLDLQADLDALLVPACAIEMVHTASLVLDDLPCMDDATLRRGVAPNHKVFGEATAILAAVGLLNEAYGVIVRHSSISDTVRRDLIEDLGHRVGLNGLVGGQELDFNGSDPGHQPVDVGRIHRAKTAGLFAHAAWSGARVAGANKRVCRSLASFGLNVGLAFQNFDDIADVKASPALVGKNTGVDGDKVTNVRQLGVDRTLRVAEYQLETAFGHLDDTGMPMHLVEDAVRRLEAQLRAQIEMTGVS